MNVFWTLKLSRGCGLNQIQIQKSETPLWKMNVAPRDLNPLAHSRKASNFDRNEHYYFVHSVRFHEKH